MLLLAGLVASTWRGGRDAELRVRDAEEAVEDTARRRGLPQK